MIHYNVWFTLKNEIEEKVGLAVIEVFLRELSVAGEVSKFQLLKNNSEVPRTKLPKFQAIVEFSDNEALALAMKIQATRGIHNGPHGKVIDVVSDFRVEVFQVLAPKPTELMAYACEI